MHIFFFKRACLLHSLFFGFFVFVFVILIFGGGGGYIFSIKTVFISSNFFFGPQCYIHAVLAFQVLCDEVYVFIECILSLFVNQVILSERGLKRTC